LALHPPHGGRQIPLLERGAVAQRSGFAGQHGNVVQWVVDGLVAPERTRMPANDLAILPEFHALGIGADLDGTPDRTSLHRVAVLVEPDEAGLRDRGRYGVEPIEGTDIGHEARALRLEDLPDRLVAQFRMRMRLGPGDVAIHQPGVELGVALEPRPRHEEPPADHSD